MEEVYLYFLDKNFDILGIVNDFTSFQWFEKWFDVGNFEIHANFEHKDLFSKAVYIDRKNKPYTGMIEVYGYTDKDIFIKGRMLEQRLEHSPLVGTKIYQGNAENVIRNIVYDGCINPVELQFKMPKLVLGQLNNYGGLVEVETKDESVLNIIKKIALEQNLSFILKYDEFTNLIYFEVLKGIDRTQNQAKNTWCVFSVEFGSIISDKYEENKYIKNYAIVQSETNQFGVVRVDVDNSAGEEKKVLFINDSSKDENLTLAEFQDILRNRGLQELKKTAILQTIEPEIDASRTMKFVLGDICSYVNNNMGITAEAQVVEVQEVIEENTNEMRIILGREALTLR